MRGGPGAGRSATGDLLAVGSQEAHRAPGYAWDAVPAEVRRLFSNRLPPDEKLHFMQMAITEASRSPFHPSVGAVIVRDGRVLARGFRDSVLVDGGDPPRTRSRHAEEVALLNAAGSLAGATLYTTLEPCFDRSTPGLGSLEPCCVRVARSGIRTVVVGLIDHDPRTAGRGAVYLAEQGLQLEFAYEGIESELYRLIGDGRFWHAAPRKPGIRSLLGTLTRAARPG
jgi:pyrimidine deaminase RibD-like protein